MIKYVYPHLPSRKTYPFIRFAGSGLANSLFVYARALVFAEREGLELINPTWFSFDPVQWKLMAKDKRTYLGIFRDMGVTYIKKWRILTFGKRVEEDAYTGKNLDADYVRIYWMKTFDEIRNDCELVKRRIRESLLPGILEKVESFDFTDTIAVHVRMGDYGNNSLPISYYKALISQIHERNPQYRFLLFSDGKESELAELLSIPYIEHVFFGSAIADIFGISSTKALIGSHSTFTDWGGYLGQLPTLLPKKPHYGSFLRDLNKEFIVETEDPTVPERFFSLI